MKNVGLHIRVYDSLEDTLKKARQLELPILQCFLINQIDRKPLSLHAKNIETVKKLIKDDFDDLYIHGSYFINPANLREGGKKTLFRELALAQAIGASGLILHSGSATGNQTQKEGIASLAYLLNSLLKEEPRIPIILENTAHGARSVGSNFQDFKKLKSLLDHPEKIKFCIDTAHAHAYGYDLSTPEKQKQFLSLVDEAVGLENVALIHLNDPAHPLGSRLDKHEPLGKGMLGTSALRSFVRQPQIASLPIILELPVLPHDEEAAMLDAVRSWHQ